MTHKFFDDLLPIFENTIEGSTTEKQRMGTNKHHIVSFFAFQGHFFAKLTDRNVSGSLFVARVLTSSPPAFHMSSLGDQINDCC